MQIEPSTVEHQRVKIVRSPRHIVANAHAKIKKVPKTKLRIAVAVGFLAIVLFTHATYVFFTTESTDDSYVSAHVHAVGARIMGTVSEVLVDENQPVKQGQVLAKLDPRDYQAQLQIAQANFLKAQKDFARWHGAKIWEPSEALDYNASNASFLSAQAELDKAKLQVEYTEIVAPADGIVGKRSVETGQQVVPGQPLFAIVEQKPWITANFKENQYANIHTGQKAEITIDAIPGHVFKGHVESLSPGSGSTFALLPPDNATGNFTKIVQRIPIRVSFDRGQTDKYLNRIAPGMSTEVTVETR